MTAVKICGITDVAGALASAELGASFLGLNFWPGTPRCVSLAAARQIAAAVRRSAAWVNLVGVFVHPTADDIAAAEDAAELDLLQFSGDEPAAAVAPYSARAIKALRLNGHTTDVLSGFEACWGVLLDTPRADATVSGASATADAVLSGASASADASLSGASATADALWGGTGRAWDYAAAAAAIPDFAGRRTFLAGGLGPANVGSIVAQLRPFAVDVCSGVESAPGKKDPRLLSRLFEEVLHAQAIPAS